MKWPGLPSQLLRGPISYLAENNNLPLAIIGPGPSLNDIDPGNIPDEVIRFRMNMFFAEPTPRFGKRVDGYFWANDLDVMYELMLSTFQNNVYDYKLFFTPNEIKPERPTGKEVAKKVKEVLRPRYDHWWLIGNHPDVVRNMLLRPLPTQTFQALATGLILGYREIHLVGIDMYQNKGERYAHSYSEDIKSKLDIKHRAPGYEDKAHTERRDLAFLAHLMKCFPDAKIYNASSVSPLKDVLPDSPLMHGKAIQVSDQHKNSSQTATEALVNGKKPIITGYKDIAPENGLVANAPAIAQNIRRIANLSGPINVLGKSLGLKRHVSKKKKNGAAGSAEKYNVLAISHEAHSKTGGYRPIKSYIEATQRNGENNRLMDLIGEKKPKNRSFKVPEAQVTIINSIAALGWDEVNSSIYQRRNVFLYLHEMGWIFDKIRTDDIVLYQRITKAIQTFPVLCVSELQRSYIEQTFAPKSTHVVYNVTDAGNTNIDAISTGAGAADGIKTILMVGTIQKRKGPDLFSQVADLAKERNLPYRFVWIGHQTEPIEQLSKNVEWQGYREGKELTDAMRSADLFFLSSHDDPFPLSCIEALSWGIPVVSGQNSGVCEVIRDLKGSGIVVERTPEIALETIQGALGDQTDPLTNFKAVQDYVSSAKFIETLDGVLKA